MSNAKHNDGETKETKNYREKKTTERKDVSIEKCYETESLSACSIGQESSEGRIASNGPARVRNPSTRESDPPGGLENCPISKP